jgi:hypothetical protein
MEIIYFVEKIRLPTPSLYSTLGIPFFLGDGGKMAFSMPRV